ncbi:hypothetical protein AB0R75_11960 [Bacillus pumilus]|uniref:DUF7003 family protein n=1 Tax=Bacillus TaxID=1386 RepID=UPI0030001C51
MNSTQILNILDEEFDNLNRPIFEWREMNYIGSKCTIIRLNHQQWLIAIQSFLLDKKGPYVTIDFYRNDTQNRYQNILMDDLTFKLDNNSYIPFSDIEPHHLQLIKEIKFNEDSFCLKNLNLHDEMDKNGKSFFRNLYEIPSFRNFLWKTPSSLLNFVGLKEGYEKVFETEEWEYPDYLTEPSETVSFKSFAQFLANEVDSVNVGIPNNHWMEWKDYDID